MAPPGRAAASSSSSSGAAAAPVYEHQKGSIIRITLNNFLTHHAAEIRPGPRLNIVLGPNGSGKSSILCAIVLGLGGNTKMVDKGDGTKNFVSRDKEKGWVEIELKGDGHHTHVIRRDLERGSNKTSFKYQGQPTTHANVQKLVQNLGIQVENLCTFLPQDKVGSFTEMDHKHLLLETLRALNGTSLEKDFQKLIELQRSGVSYEKHRDSVEKELNNLKQLVEGMERDVQRMEDRQKYVKKAEHYGKALLWWQVFAKQQEGLKLREEKNELKEKMAAASAEINPFKERRDALKRLQTETATQLKTDEKALESAHGAFKKSEQACEDRDTGVTAALGRLADVQKQRNNKVADMNRVRADLEKAIAARDNFDPEQLKEQMAEIQGRRRAAVAARDEAGEQLEQARVQFDDLKKQYEDLRRRRGALSDEHKRRLDALAGHNNDLARNAHAIYLWIQDRKREGGTFRGRIYGPVCMEVQVDSEGIAACIERHCGGNMLFGFIVEDPQDKHAILNEWKDKCKKKISLYDLQSNWRSVLQAPEPLSKAKMDRLKEEDGVQGYMSDFIKGAPEVVATMMNWSNVNRVLVGNERTDANIDRVMGELLGGGPGDDPDDRGGSQAVVYTEKRGARDGLHLRRYQGNVSRYNGAKSTQSSNVYKPQPQVLRKGGGQDTEEQKKELEAQLGALEPQLKEAKHAVDTALKAFNKANAELEKLKDDAVALKVRERDGKSTFDKVARLEEKLHKLEKELHGGADRETQDVQVTVQKAVAKYSEALRDHVKSFGKTLQAFKVHCGPKLCSRVATNLASAAERDLREKSAEHKELHERYEAKDKELKAAVADYKRERERAEKEAPISGSNCDQEFADTFTELKNREATAEEIQTVMVQAQTDAENIVDNPELLAQYERHKKDIAKKEEEFKEAEDQCNNRDETIAKIAKPFQQSLESVANKLNRRFSTYMAQMQCQGEVKLHKHDTDYAEWGIKIYVKFREGTTLSELSAKVQSGGERSVSTILYLMGLQDIMSSPFRAVDEINQGMDERNERSVFARIVANSTKCQYFLVTPKLLPELTAMELPHVNVLFVFNAPRLFGYRDWDVRRFLELARGTKRGGAAAATGQEGHDDDDEQEGGGGGQGQSKRRRREG